MTVSRAISSLFLFRSKIEEAVNLVPGMSAEEKLKAVQFWNMVSEKLQDIVNNSAADINAVALNMSEQEPEKTSLDLNNSSCMVPQNSVPASEFINMSSNYTVYTETNATFHTSSVANNQLKQFISHASSFSSSKEQSHNNDLSDLPHIHHLNTVRYSDISESNQNNQLLSTANIAVNNCDKFSKDVPPSSSAHLLEVKGDSQRVSEMYHSPRRKSSRLQPSRKIKTKTSETIGNFDSNNSSPTVIINHKTSMKFQGKSLSKESVSQNCNVIDFKTMDDSSEDIEDSAPVEDLDVSNEASFENIVSFVVSNSEEIIEQNQEEQFNKITKENYTEDKNSLICKICSESFPDDDSLARHYLRLHERPYCCLECKAKFTTKGNLIVHMRRHTGEKPFCCSKCPANFTTKGNLKRHIKTHSGEKPWECNRCGSCFTEKKSLTVHMRRHTGERPYICKICGKSFSQTSILQGHMAMHLGLKMHLCEKCGKSFRQKSQLRTHRLRHDNIRSFKCQTCSATFLTKGDLLRHQRTHTGQKPFSCDVCLKTFTRQQSLNEHTNRHYGLKPYKCKYCSKAFAEMSACYKHTKYHEKIEEANKFKQDDMEAVQQTSHPVTNHFPDANGVENKEPNFVDGSSYIAVVLDSKETNQSEYDERNQAVSFFNSGLEETSIVPNGVGVLTTINILTNNSTLPQNLQTVS